MYQTEPFLLKGKSYQQLANTAQELLKEVPGSAGNIELRIYMNATQYGKLLDGSLPGWRANNGYLGWLDESDQFVHAILELFLNNFVPE